jgi:hypothetical protein
MKMYTTRNIYTLILAAILVIAPVVHAAEGPCGCCLPAQGAPEVHDEASCCGDTTAREATPMMRTATTGHTCGCSMQSHHSPIELPRSATQATGHETGGSLLSHVPDWAMANASPAQAFSTPPVREACVCADGYLEVCRLLI